MLTIKTNALTDKGVMRPAVRKVIRENIEAMVIKLANGTEVVMEPKAAGEWFSVVAKADDVDINAKVELTITVNDYKAPTKKAVSPKEPEYIEVI